jgi:hypothetical protein
LYPESVASIRYLSRSLGVPLGDVVKAAMSLGYVKTATAPLSDDEVELVAMALRLSPTLPSQEDGPASSGVREPRNPRPSRPSAGAASTPGDD